MRQEITTRPTRRTDSGNWIMALGIEQSSDDPRKDYYESKKDLHRAQQCGSGAKRERQKPGDPSGRYEQVSRFRAPKLIKAEQLIYPPFTDCIHIGASDAHHIGFQTAPIWMLLLLSGAYVPELLWRSALSRHKLQRLRHTFFLQCAPLPDCVTLIRH